MIESQNHRILASWNGRIRTIVSRIRESQQFIITDSLDYKLLESQNLRIRECLFCQRSIRSMNYRILELQAFRHSLDEFQQQKGIQRPFGWALFTHTQTTHTHTHTHTDTHTHTHTHTHISPLLFLLSRARKKIQALSYLNVK